MSSSFNQKTKKAFSDKTDATNDPNAQQTFVKPPTTVNANDSHEHKSLGSHPIQKDDTTTSTTLKNEPKSNKKISWSWMESYNNLKMYKELHGHCRISRRNGKLGEWVRAQRSHYRYYTIGKPTYLKEHHIKLLEKIGFEWSIRNKDQNIKKTFRDKTDATNDPNAQQTFAKRPKIANDSHEHKSLGSHPIQNDDTTTSTTLKNEPLENQRKKEELQAKQAEIPVEVRKRIINDLCHELLATKIIERDCIINFFKAKQPNYPWLALKTFESNFIQIEQREFRKREEEAEVKERERLQENLLRQAASRVRNVSQTIPKFVAAYNEISFEKVADVSALPANHWRWTDLYNRLGIPKDSSQSEIRKQYLKFARLYHPDKSSSNDAEARFLSIKEAYEVLMHE